MNGRLVITLFSLGAAPWITAQNFAHPSEIGSAKNIVGKIGVIGSGKANEVTVVLPPPDASPSAVDEKPSTSTPSEETPSPAEVTNRPEASAKTVAPAEDAPEYPQPGVAVRVERLQTGSKDIDPAKVKLLAPFPAKLPARSPEGWLIENSKSAPPLTREIELSPGKRITLSVRPHLLVAEADGSSVFQIAEPGFSPSLGYRQNATVAAILSTSIRQLDDDSRQLGTVIDQLQQLLVSLPQPATAPEPDPEPKLKTNSMR